MLADLGRSPDRIIAINAYPAAGCKAPSYLLASSSQVNQEKALRLPWRSELWHRKAQPRGERAIQTRRLGAGAGHGG